MRLPFLHRNRTNLQPTKKTHEEQELELFSQYLSKNQEIPGMEMCALLPSIIIRMEDRSVVCLAAPYNPLDEGIINDGPAYKQEASRAIKRTTEDTLRAFYKLRKAKELGETAYPVIGSIVDMTKVASIDLNWNWRPIVAYSLNDTRAATVTDWATKFKLMPAE